MTDVSKKYGSLFMTCKHFPNSLAWGVYRLHTCRNTGCSRQVCVNISSMPYMM